MTDMHTEIKEQIDFMNSKNSFGRTALYFPAMLGDASSIEMFIDMGATLLIRDNENYTILDVALQNERCEFSQKIIRKFHEFIDYNNFIKESPQIIITDAKEASAFMYWQDPEGEFMQAFIKDLAANENLFKEICPDFVE